MKKVILTLALIAGMGVATENWASSAPKHRYTPTTQQVDDKTSAPKEDQQVDAQETTDEGIEAYSDTTSVDTAAVDVDEADSRSSYHSKYSMANYDDPFDFFGSVFGTGTLVFVIILCVLVGLLFVFAPLIIVFLIVRYLYRRHCDHVKLAEMAMEKGINIPEESRPMDKQSNEYLQKRGIRNAFLGVGLCIMFLIWDADFLAGIGALIFFYGMGQVVIGLLPSLKKWRHERGEGQARS